MARKTSKKRQEEASYKHKSFKRSYREDYVREIEVPGIARHFAETFRVIFGNYKLFLPLILIGVILAVATIETLNESGIVFTILIFLFLWLTTIFILRQRMAKHEIKLRDALYNAMSPLVATFVVLVVAAIESLPIVVVVVAYSTALETDFFALPFYAFLFLVFAALLILLSAYLLSSTLMALVAVSAPGVYPAPAFRAVTKMMMGRRIRFVLRLVAVAILLVAIWAVIVAPLMVTMHAPASLTLVCIDVLGCFSSVFVATYLYLYYRWVLDYDVKEEKNDKKRG